MSRINAEHGKAPPLTRVDTATTPAVQIRAKDEKPKPCNGKAATGGKDTTGGKTPQVARIPHEQGFQKQASWGLMYWCT